MNFLVIASLAESLINFRGPLITALQARGMKVHVAAPDMPSGSTVREYFESVGVVVHEIPLQRTGTNPVADLKTLWHLWRLMASLKPDRVLGYTIKPVIYGTFAAWLARVPERFSLITGLGYSFQINSGKRSWLQKISQSLYKISLARASVVFFQNPDDRALFLDSGLISSSIRTCVVNGSGVDINFFNVATLPPEPACFLMVARLLGDKGVREYAHAASRIRTRYPNSRCLLAGWIDSNPDAIKQHELDTWVKTGSIEYLGRLADVRPAIAQCSVYVLPSYREGTPRTVLEAMSMGRAIITSDAPGCRETVIEGDNGFLIPIKSVDALENAMIKFIENPDLAKSMGIRAREIAAERYDVEKVNASMLQEMGIN